MWAPLPTLPLTLGDADVPPAVAPPLTLDPVVDVLLSVLLPRLPLALGDVELPEVAPPLPLEPDVLVSKRLPTLLLTLEPDVPVSVRLPTLPLTLGPALVPVVAPPAAAPALPLTPEPLLVLLSVPEVDGAVDVPGIDGDVPGATEGLADRLSVAPGEAAGDASSIPATRIAC